MSTYGDMQTNLALFTRRTDLSSEIQTAIKRAIKHYEREEWPWQETRSAALSTAASTQTVALPSDFLYDLSLSITVNGTAYVLPKKTQQEIEDLNFAATLTQQPTCYAIWADSIYFYPTPDAVYSLTFNYYATLTELSNSTDTNEWTTTAEEMVEARAQWWLAAKVMRNQALAASCKDVELDAYQMLRRQSTMRSASNKLKPCYF